MLIGRLQSQLLLYLMNGASLLHCTALLCISSSSSSSGVFWEQLLKWHAELSSSKSWWSSNRILKKRFAGRLRQGLNMKKREADGTSDRDRVINLSVEDLLFHIIHITPTLLLLLCSALSHPSIHCRRRLILMRPEAVSNSYSNVGLLNSSLFSIYYGDSAVCICLDRLFRI